MDDQQPQNTPTPPAPLKKRLKRQVVEYVKAFMVAALAAFVIRSFLIEPFKIPSSSMVPTLLVGDHIFVNKFAYGLRIPGTTWWPVRFADPKRGEIAVFIYPQDDSIDYIKRVVGLPGDHLHIEGTQVTVNGEGLSFESVEVLGRARDNKRLVDIILPQALAAQAEVPHELPFFVGFQNYRVGLEGLGEVYHWVQYSRFVSHPDVIDLIVPEGHYFMMGDNRDNSSDSRVWGFVPRENFKGKALLIWISSDNIQGGVRWGRFGQRLL